MQLPAKDRETLMRLVADSQPEDLATLVERLAMRHGADRLATAVANAGQPPEGDPFAAGLAPATKLPTGTPPSPLFFGLYPGAVTYIAGETDAGKSSMLYNVAVHAALGERLWELDFLRSLRVLYVDPENAGDYRSAEWKGGRCARRLAEIGKGMPEGLVFHDGRGVDLSRSDHRDALARLVKAHRFDLVILDPLSNLFNTVNENDNSEAAAQMRAVCELSRGTGACVVVVHHTGRNADDPTHRYGRGASARLAAADVGVTWRSRSPEKRGEDASTDDTYQGKAVARRDVCRLQIAKDRPGGFGHASVYLRMAGQDRFERATPADWKSARTASDGPSRADECRTAVVELMADGEERPVRAIAEALQSENFGINTVRESLHALVADGGLIERQAERGTLWYRCSC